MLLGCHAVTLIELKSWIRFSLKKPFRSVTRCYLDPLFKQ